MIRSPLRPWLLLAPLVMACADPVTEPEETYDSPTVAPEQVGEVFDISGTFAYRTQMTQHVENAFDETVYDVQTVVNWMVLTWEQGASPTEIKHTARLCLTELSEVSGSTTTLLSGFYENTEAITYTASLSEAAVGAEFVHPQIVELRGVELEDPLNDPLPVAPTDETDCDDYVAPGNVFDYDGDGNAGYTVVVDGALDADLWAVERFVFSARGTVIDLDHVSGYVEGYIEDKFVCSTKPKVIATDVDIYPDTEPENNFFEIVRVEEGFTCDKLLDQRDVIFDLE